MNEPSSESAHHVRSARHDRAVARAAHRSRLVGVAEVRDGSVVAADATFRRLVAPDGSEVVGRPWRDLADPVPAGSGPRVITLATADGDRPVEVTTEALDDEADGWFALVVPVGSTTTSTRLRETQEWLAAAHRARAVAETERDTALESQEMAEGDRDVALEAQELAEAGRDVARRSQRLAESDRDVARRAEGVAEAARDVARRARRLAEVERNEARRALAVAEADRELARADRDSVAEESELNAATARVLVRTALPRQLPSLPRAALAARYSPAPTTGIVGGDWYDALVLPDGRLFCSIGDATGNGLPAATVMGRLANAARVAAVMDPDPAAVVAVLDRALRAYDDTLATALLAVYDPHDGVLRWARAGHPPPALARPDDDAVLVEPPARPPLGGPVDLAIDPPPVHEVRLPPGSVCALFTDGLVERRGEHIDDGLGRVTTALGRAPRLGDPERIADRIMEACAPVDVDDDVCLLVLATR